MNIVHCPYLGLKDDPTTALNFPSTGNFCNKARPAAPVTGSYQQQYCLTAEHTACPVFLATHPVPLPTAVSSPEHSRISSRRGLAILGIPFLLTGTTALVLAWNTINNQVKQIGLIASTGGALSTPATWTLLSNQPTTTPLPFLTTTPTDDNPIPTTCPPPEGWVPYIANPTDSLYRLSMIYGVSVEQLQQVNCIGENTAILPGQVIFVPVIPTSTNTLTPTIPPVTISLVDNDNRDNQPPSPSATPVPDRPASPSATSVPDRQEPKPPAATNSPSTDGSKAQSDKPVVKTEPSNKTSKEAKVKPEKKAKTKTDGKSQKGKDKDAGKGKGKGK